MLKSKYPNNECGECPVWLGGKSIKEMIKYCQERNCDLYYEDAYDCDGRCLNCDEFDPIRGCMKEEG